MSSTALTLAEGQRGRVPQASFVEGTWATAEIDRGTAAAVIAPAFPKDWSIDVQEFVERAAGWLEPGGYLLLNAGHRELSAYAPHSWLDASSDDEPRRAIPTEGALHAAGLEIRDYQILLQPTEADSSTMWLIATPGRHPEPAAASPAGTRGAIRRAGPLRSQPLTVFVHIPKAAGTTFAQILRNNYPPDSVGGIGNLFKGSGGSDPAVVERVRNADKLTLWMNVLTGHLPLGVRDSLPADTRYVTFLREPVDRVLSHYHVLIGQASARPERRNCRRLDSGHARCEEVLADGRYIPDNLQTRMLCGDPEPLGEVTPKMLDQAKENLRDTSLVFGLAERYDESLVLIGRRLGLAKLAYQSRRVNSDRPREIPSEISGYAREFDRYDLELYEYARDLFAERANQEGDGLAADVQALRKACAALGEPGRPGRRASRGARPKQKRRRRGGTAQST